jgi:hypothetical protein
MPDDTPPWLHEADRFDPPSAIGTTDIVTMGFNPWGNNAQR